MHQINQGRPVLCQTAWQDRIVLTFKLGKDVVSVTLRLSVSSLREGISLGLVTRPAESVQELEGLYRVAWTHQGNGVVE